VLLSQIELPDEMKGSPRLRSGSLSGRVSSKERRKVLSRMASENTMQLAKKSARPPLLFRIEKVMELKDMPVELQLLNKGFSVDWFEFTVEGGREMLLKVPTKEQKLFCVDLVKTQWFDALRSCGCGKLVDTALSAETARGGSSSSSSSSSSSAPEESTDEDLARMMDEFAIFSGGSMVKKGKGRNKTCSQLDKVVRDGDDGGDAQMSSVLNQMNNSEKNSNASKSDLLALFQPPPNIVPIKIRMRTGSVIEGGEEEEEASELANMLASSKWTLRALRETK
jgi:hypothetical protein